MGRSPCCDDSILLKKGPWTPEEDEKLIDHIHKHGHGSWRSLPNRAGLNRCGKSCRLRWTNYLRPDIKRGKFTDEEEQVIINLHSVLGNKWSKIAGHLPGRTDNEIKNHWNTHLRKKLLKRGIDPQTHKPISDINLLSNLSQLLSPSNLSNLINPWDNILRSQVDVTQLAKIQILESLMQVMNTITLPNIAQSNTGLLGTHSIAESTLYNSTNSPQAPFDFPNLGFNPQMLNNFSLEGGFQPEEVVNVNYNSMNNNYCDQTENSLPALVSASPVENSTVKHIESEIDPTYPFTNSPPSNFSEANWEKFLDDEVDTLWKVLLE